MQRHEGGYYVRLAVVDRPVVMGAIAARMGERMISLEAIMQKRAPKEAAAAGVVPVVLMTHGTTEASICDALAHAVEDGVVREKPQLSGSSARRFDGGRRPMSFVMPAPKADAAAAAAVEDRHMRVLAIALMCGAMLCFTGLDTSSKWLGLKLPTAEIVFARYVGAALIALVAARPWTHPAVLRSTRPGLQALRSLLLLGATASVVVAVRKLQLAETATISFLTPIFVALMAGPLLGERVGRERMIAILLGVPRRLDRDAPRHEGVSADCPHCHRRRRLQCGIRAGDAQACRRRSRANHAGLDPAARTRADDADAAVDLAMAR